MRRWGIIFFIFIIIFMCGDNIRSDIIKSELFGDVKNEVKASEKFRKNDYKKNFNTGLKIKKHIMVKNIVEKEKTIEYWCGDVLAVKMKYGMGGGSDKKGQNFYKVDRVSIGDRLLIIGRQENLDNFFIRDFNYGRYLKSKGCKTYIRVEYMKLVSESFLYKNIGKFKTYLIAANRDIYKKNSDILNAILLADKTKLSQEERYVFSDSGTSHIMAVSGLHISVICGIFLIFIGKINSYRRLIVLASFLYLYNLLVGGSPSITRAISMTLVSCMGFFLFRRVDMVNILFIIAGVMIYKNPYEIYNISFQLSFLALLSLLVFTKYIKKYVYSDLLAASIAVNIFTWPIVVYNYSDMSTMGIMGNVIVLPVIFTIVSMDIASLFFYSCDIPIYRLIVYINSSLVDFLIDLLKQIGNFGVNNVEVRDLSLLCVCLYLVMVSALSIYLEIYYIKNNKYEIDHIKMQENEKDI